MDNYIIVEEYFPSTLQRKVNEYIDEGYVPCGGISMILVYNKQEKYVQAMVKQDLYKIIRMQEILK